MHPRTEMKERNLFIWVSFSTSSLISPFCPIFLSFFIGEEDKMEREKWRGREKEKKFEGKEWKKMELKIWGRAEDVQELVAPLVNYMGEKLRIIVEPCPIEENEPRRFYVEVERKKKTENKMWKEDVKRNIRRKDWKSCWKVALFVMQKE